MNNNYLSISDLLNKLSKRVKKLEKGKLSADSLEEMLEESRAIYERITILRYKALVGKTNPIVAPVVTESKIESKPTTIEEESTGISLKFSIPKEEVKSITPQNQKNLLDEIQEIDEIKTSVNDQFAENKLGTIGDTFKKSKIEDLRKVIRLNQKFLFMSDLFQGEKELYDKTIDKINACETFLEASLYLNEEIEETYNWDKDSVSVKQFKELVSRKFS
jgi:hypothetical protein